MAKYHVTYTCGHSGAVQVVGPVANRQRIADKEATKLCPDCYRARLEAERAEASAKAAEQAKAAGLPTLVGSPKQIAWAESIRAKAAAQLAELTAKLDAAPPTADQDAIAIAREIIASVLARTEARAWIDSQDTRYDQHWIAVQTKSRMGK